MASGKPLKVAIVHDWLYGGGAERVVYELHRMFPEAPIYTSYCTDEWRNKLDGKVVTGFLQYWPFSALRKFLPVLRIWWFTHLDLSGYDLIISSSGNGEAKGVRIPAGTMHICYCHAPTHFYWRHYDAYIRSPGFGVFNPFARIGLRLLVAPLRKWDLKAAKRPDMFVANSTHTQDEIKQFYGRDAVVVHPPVDIDRFTGHTSTVRTGFVTAGRQTPYKRTDIIVAACTKLGVPLTVIGRGPEHSRLVAMAGPTVTFPDNVADTEMGTYFADARAFLFAAYEDFGITPVEAMAAGTPVIAYKAGGALDYVQNGKTGEFFDAQSVNALSQAMQAFDGVAFHAVQLKHFAEEFSPQAFQHAMFKVIRQALDSSAAAPDGPA